MLSNIFRNMEHVNEKVSDYVTQVRKTNMKYLELKSNRCDLKIITKTYKTIFKTVYRIRTCSI